MTLYSPFKYALLAALPLLAACDGSTVRETVGLTRKAPDEFRVVARPPLSVPPEFNLRPPAKPGEQSETGADAPSYKQAQELVTGTEATGLKPGNADTAVISVFSGSLETPADSTFLENAGANKADPAIRELLQAETAEQAPEDKSLLESLRNHTPNEPMVDAKAEAERLKTNKAEGKPATEGDTPTVKPKDTGPLGRMLGY